MKKLSISSCWLVILLYLISGSFNECEMISLQQDQELSLYKGYSGYRLSNQSTRIVYYHELTIAVVEVEDNHMLNCELIEIFSDNEREKALFDLTKSIEQSKEVTFEYMIKLMNQCEKLDLKFFDKIILTSISEQKNFVNTNHPENESNFSDWILPDTKWCGPGDIALNYFDLGVAYDMDKCCRKHDLCPVKIKSNGTRYSLTNQSFYTISHCICEDEFLNCLKSSNKPAANLIGNIYFNMMRNPCITDTINGRIFQESKEF